MDSKKIQLVSQQPPELKITNIILRPLNYFPPESDPEEQELVQGDLVGGQETSKSDPAQDSRQSGEPNQSQEASEPELELQLLGSDLIDSELISTSEEESRQLKRDSSTQTDDSLLDSSEPKQESQQNKERSSDSSTQTNQEISLQTDEVTDSDLKIETERDVISEQFRTKVNNDVEKEIEFSEPNEHDNKEDAVQSGQEIISELAQNSGQIEQEIVKSKSDNQQNNNNTESILKVSEENLTSPLVTEINEEICGEAEQEPDSITIDTETTLNSQLEPEAGSHPEPEIPAQKVSRQQGQETVEAHTTQEDQVALVVTPGPAIGLVPAANPAVAPGSQRRSDRPPYSITQHPYQQRTKLLAECLLVRRLNVPTYRLPTALSRSQYKNRVCPRRSYRSEQHARGEETEVIAIPEVDTGALINGPPIIENGWMGNNTLCDYSTTNRYFFRHEVSRPRQLVKPPAVMRTGYGYSCNRPDFQTTQRAHFRDPEQLYGELHATRNRSISPVTASSADQTRTRHQSSPSKRARESPQP